MTMNNTIGIIINNPSKELGVLTEHRNPITLPFFARYRLIDFSLSDLVNSNVPKIGIIASDKYRSLLDHVGTGQEWGLSRKSQALVILQGSRKIGDVCARHINLMDFEKNDMVFTRNYVDNVIISTPNIICRLDYEKVLDFHNSTNADVTLIGTPIDDPLSDTGCMALSVDEHGRVLDISTKNNINATHQYAAKLIIRKETLLRLMQLAPDLGEYELLTLIMANLSNLDVRCYSYTGYLRRILSIKDYFDANMELLDPNISGEIFGGNHIVYTKIKDNHPTLYKASSHVSHSCVASGSVLEGTIKNSILFRQIHQQEGSTITNSILMEGCHIGKGTVLDYVIADRNVIIGDNVVLKGTKTAPVVLKKEMVI